jgi:hypothetical protein
MLNRRFLPLALVLLCSACSGNVGIDDPHAIRSIVLQELLQLETGIERGDTLRASSIVADAFTMDNNVATRYRDSDWSGSGVASFRSFLNDVFHLHDNIELDFSLGDLVVEGDLATATVTVDWHSQRTDVVPPGQYVARSTDYFFFQRTAGSWLLLKWREVPAPPPPFDQ